MSAFIVYGADGEIKRTGTCSPTDVVSQSNTGEFVCVGECIDAGLHRVKNGKVERKTDEEIEEVKNTRREQFLSRGQDPIEKKLEQLKKRIEQLEKKNVS